MSDCIKMRGSIEMVLQDFQGNITDKRTIHNVVVTAGRSWVLQQICSSNIVTSQSISYLAVGTGTSNAPATSDTALQSESTRVAVGTFSTTGLSANPPSWQAQSSFATNQANTTLGEVALFNSSSAGTMLARATFSTINKTTSNTLSVSYTISN